MAKFYALRLLLCYPDNKKKFNTTLIITLESDKYLRSWSIRLGYRKKSCRRYIDRYEDIRCVQIPKYTNSQDDPLNGVEVNAPLHHIVAVIAKQKVREHSPCANMLNIQNVKKNNIK